MEREELAELFQTYGTDVFRLAFSYLGSQADAEDCLLYTSDAADE